MNQVLIEVYESSATWINVEDFLESWLFSVISLTKDSIAILQFVHGGVFGTEFNISYNGGINKTNFAVVINKNYVIDNGFYLDDEKLSEDDFRGFSQTIPSNCYRFSYWIQRLQLSQIYKLCP